MTLSQLSAAGVSVWLDDLSRGRIASGGLQDLIANRSVVGVTTNPTIFAQALRQGEDYAEQVGQIAAGIDGEITPADVDRAVIEVTTRDVSEACTVFADVHAQTEGKDGRVSLEVDPRLAEDTAGTIAAAKDLWARLDRPNAMIKIPATQEGLPAITEAIANGISVNVTLVFSLERYRHVVEAYLAGLERAHEAGIDLATIRSVASVFVSRVDTEVDRRLEEIGSEEALGLKGRAGIANSILAYQIFEQLFSSARWEVLEAEGAHRQRPLWASTGVKDPNLPDTLYVTGLVAPDTVNTMPEKTLEAFADHGEVEGDVVSGRGPEADAVLDGLAAVGVDYADVTAVLEREGLEKFEASWTELLETVATQLRHAQEA